MKLPQVLQPERTKSVSLPCDCRVLDKWVRPSDAGKTQQKYLRQKAHADSTDGSQNGLSAVVHNTALLLQGHKPITNTHFCVRCCRALQRTTLSY